MYRTTNLPNTRIEVADALRGIAVAGIILVQYAFCRIWLRRHSHGPVEWLWKKLTWLDIPFLDRKIAS